MHKAFVRRGATLNGLANYYRRFVEGYGELAAPLTALGNPTARFTWTVREQQS